MEPTLGPIVGAVTPTTARIWFFAQRGGEWTLRVRTEPEQADEREALAFVAHPHRREPRAFFAQLEGLQPGSQHTFHLVSSEGASASNGSFRTPPATGPVALRLAVGSCMRVQQLTVQRAWYGMRAADPDLLLLLGDNVYLPSFRWLFRRLIRDKEDVRDVYARQRRVEGFREATRHTPTLATWDDHDFAWNDAEGDIDERTKRWALEVFEESWPNASYGTPDDPGVYHAAWWGDVQFLLLDNRFRRGLEPGSSMLGAAQEEWLFRRLGLGARLNVVASGSCLTLGKGWSSHPRARRRILERLDSAGIDNVLWLSGDVHQHALIRHTRAPLGRDLVEVVSSPLARRKRFLRLRDERYALIDIDTGGALPRIEVHFYRGDADTPFERHGPIEIGTPRSHEVVAP